MVCRVEPRGLGRGTAKEVGDGYVWHIVDTQQKNTLERDGLDVLREGEREGKV